tara:strand:+ start:5633 stop:6367 length:735 start_codon:yes stop_codon:yes gene_type:complete
MRLRTLCFSFLLAACPSLASAAIYAPGDAVPGTSGDVFGWARGDADSTYSGWDFFEGVPGGDGGPLTDSTPDVMGQFGTPSVISTTGGYLPVGSGNLYSPFAALDFTVLANSGISGGDNTRIVAQFQTGGSELDYDSILLGSDVGTDGTIAPNLLIETGRIALGGFGGDRVQYLALWDLDSSQSAFRIDFNASESSLSLEEFHVDTFTQATSFLTPTAVPEPGSLAFLGLATTAMVLRRKRRGC